LGDGKRRSRRQTVLGDLKGARSVFEPGPELVSKPVKIGDATRLYSASLIFRSGVCFVRLVTFQPGATLISLARGIEAGLAATPGAR